MFLFNAVRSVFGALKIEQLDNKFQYPTIRISGINSKYLESDLRSIFKTSKVYTSIFDHIDSYTLIFPSFFSLEVEKIMNMIIQSPGRLRTSRRTARLIIDGLYEVSWLKYINVTDYPKRLDQSKLKQFRFKPLEYQQAFIDMFDRVTYQYSLNGILLDAVMGSGKTITSLYIAECANCDVKIIVSPNNALENVWAKTIRNDIYRDITVWTTKSTLPYKGEEYILIHYEGLRKAIEEISKIRGKSFSLIIDECHNFAEYKSQQSQNLIALQKLVKSSVVIPQSGTTFKAVGAEIVPMMLLLDPTFDEELVKRFNKMYGASATEALELLKYRMGAITHKVTKDQVGLPEPKILNFSVSSPNSDKYTLRKVKDEMVAFVQERRTYYKQKESQTTKDYIQCLELYEYKIKDSKERELYKQYLADVKTIRASGARDVPNEIAASNSFEKNYILPKLPKEKVAVFKEVKTIYKYVELKINGECLGRVLAARRKECAMEIARNIPYSDMIESTTKKTLVFTVYVDTLKLVKETLEQQKYTTLAVFGETNKDLTNIINTFEHNQTFNPLVATYKSLSTAVPMTMADVMIMVDTPFRDYVFQQTIARINRLGTTTQTYVYIAALDTDKEPNLSTRTLDILRWSQSQIEAITGVKSPFEITDDQMSFESLKTVSYDYSIESDLESYFFNRLNEY